MLLYTTALVVVDNYNNSHGILFLKQGKVYMQTDNIYIACVFNTSCLKETFQSIHQIYYKVKYLEKKETSKYSHYNFNQQIETLINQIEERLDFFTIDVKRQKRGLINALGHVVKSISGNLDQKDADYFNNQLNQIAFENKNIKQYISMAKSVSLQFEKQ